nr:hypothetical protein [Tanacetum cinerariifolium]
MEFKKLGSWCINIVLGRDGDLGKRRYMRSVMIETVSGVEGTNLQLCDHKMSSIGQFGRGLMGVRLVSWAGWHDNRSLMSSLSNRAAEKAFEASKDKDETIKSLEELRFLAISTKDLSDDDAYWIERKKAQIKAKLRAEMLMEPNNKDDSDE